jgi:acetaldehyde dehydrogenase (acetylating)
VCACGRTKRITEKTCSGCRPSVGFKGRVVRDHFAEAVARSLEKHGLPGTDKQIEAISDELKRAASEVRT